MPLSAAALTKDCNGLFDRSTGLRELSFRFGSARGTACRRLAQDVKCPIGERLGNRLELSDEIVVVHAITVVTVVA